MSKVGYREPAFLRDIHRCQIINYNKTKSMNVIERIGYLAEQANLNIKRLNYHIVKGKI